LIYFLVGLVEKDVSFISFVSFSTLFLIIYFLLVYLLKGLDKEDKDIIKSFYVKFKKIKLF